VPSNRFRSRLALGFASLWSGCSLSAGPAFTRPTSSGASIAVGPSIEGALQLPRSFQTFAGIDWSQPGTPNDSWRLGLSYGYTTLPTATGRLAWEISARGGVLGAASTASAGGFGGGRVAMLLRLGSLPEPWEADSAFGATSLIVADVGVNGLARSGASFEGEISSRVLLRIQFSSALLP
jgi:hypothetical protein